jgi:aspartate-semialdehyde dehydrogenase
MNERAYTVIVAGATGLVGRKMIQVLEERNFPVATLIPMASARSVGQTVKFKGSDYPVVELNEKNLAAAKAAFALFSAGGSVSKEFSPIAARYGTIVIDNSSAFRMEPDVPLVVPEVNPGEALKHKGIIANPNCSTIQMVVALKPLHDAFTIKRIVVSTYQSVTGAGWRGQHQLELELAGKPVDNPKFPHRIAMNALPHIDVFGDDGYTKEEVKMVNETKKIMGDDSIRVTATCVRVPVLGGHSESINVEFAKPCDITSVRDLLARAPGVVLVDDPQNARYPLPLDAHDRDEVFVGRVRIDPTVPSGINMWVVSDNLRKGAATNAVQIAEVLMQGLESRV